MELVCRWRSRILAFIVTSFNAGLVATSLGRDCNVSHVIHCYDTLTHYEGLGFPFYGRDHLDLIETCRAMNDSFDCVEVYSEWCRGRGECEEDCQHMIDDIDVFNNNTGLRHAQRELCNPKSSLREAYLENYECLERNEEKYAACHRLSLKSQEYMITIQEPVDGIAARCCFFTWLHDCFTNITRDSCNENATLFVSFTLHTLLSQMSIPLCGPSPQVCDTPPLPDREEIDPDPREEHDFDDDNSLERETWEDPLEKENHNFTEIDNSLENKSPCASPTYSVWTITVSFAILLSCFIL